MQSELASSDTTTMSAPFQMNAEESKYRLVNDSFLTPDECRLLSNYTRKYRVVGDGYGGNPHPHIPTEEFAGISFEGKSSHPDDDEYQLALQVIMRARRVMMEHFRVPFLWLDYGHLVSRTAIEPPSQTEDDYSHPWHYDNQSKGVMHRTHTAILYINDGFEGGNTCFKEAEFGPFREVQPKAGTLVGFSVAENAHAVTKLISGERFVLNMWFSTYWKKYFKHRKNFSLLQKS